GVTDTNEPAIRLYENYGFSPNGEGEPLHEGSALMSHTLVLMQELVVVKVAGLMPLAIMTLSKENATSV
ncbi:MAG: hypothetical protein ACTIJQ_09365, partial [Alcaligenes sp.]